MKTIRLDTSAIVDWNTFHQTFAGTFGFPAFYGRNMNAWNDCMTCLDDADAGMSSVTVEPGELLLLDLGDVSDFERCRPELFRAIVDGVAFVNWRRIDVGEPPVLVLSYHR